MTLCVQNCFDLNYNYTGNILSSSTRTFNDGDTYIDLGIHLAKRMGLNRGSCGDGDATVDWIDREEAARIWWSML